MEFPSPSEFENFTSKVSTSFRFTQIKEIDAPTSNAITHYEEKRNRNRNHKSHPFVQLKVVKRWNPTYYNDMIIPLPRKENEQKEEPPREITVHEIYLNSSFSFSAIRDNACQKQYSPLSEVAKDLTKVLRFVEARMEFIVKEFDIHSSCYSITFKTKSAMYKLFKTIKLWHDDKKTLTVEAAFEQYSHVLSIDEMKFFSDNPLIFSLFHGFKYQMANEQNDEIVKPFWISHERLSPTITKNSIDASSVGLLQLFIILVKKQKQHLFSKVCKVLERMSGQKYLLNCKQDIHVQMSQKLQN